VYLLFALSRGALSGFYPYPFIDVSKLGLGKVLLNSLGLLVALVIFSLLFLAIGKIKSRKIAESSKD
jgi:Na+/H+-dicarboxylate symporter